MTTKTHDLVVEFHQSRSKIDELQLARHLRGNSFVVKINPADWRDVGRRQTNRGGDEVMVAENAVGRVEADPARSRKEDFRPRVQRTFRPSRLRVAFTQVTADEPRRESHSAQDLRQQHGYIPAGAAAQLESFRG